MLTRGELISAEYLAEQRALHAAPRGYGGKGDKWADAVCELVRLTGATSVLDYGCGAGTLVKALRGRLGGSVRLAEYDPAISGKDAMPSFADVVVSTDVWEHVEAEKLDAILRHVRGLARKAVFVVVATRPSNKKLSDGRNAHLAINDCHWWAGRALDAGFTISKEYVTDKEWRAVLLP